MDVAGFGHVSINTNGTDLGALVAFYRDVLGLVDEPRPDIPGVAGHWFRVGALQLHLVDAPTTAAAAESIDPVGPHFCLQVRDLANAVEELDRRGIDHRRAVQGEGTVQIWFADPAGNTIEIQDGPGDSGPPPKGTSSA